MKEENKYWAYLISGDKADFKAFYKYFTPMMLNYGFRFTKDAELIKDTSHDLFIDLWEKRKNLGNVTFPKLYLFTSLRRRLLNKITQKKKNDPIDTNLSSEFVNSHEFYLILDEKRSEENQVLNEYLGLLSPREREVLYLRIYQDLSHKKIAELLSIQKTASRNYYSAAIKKLRMFYSSRYSSVHFFLLFIRFLLF